MGYLELRCSTLGPSTHLCCITCILSLSTKVNDSVSIVPGKSLHTDIHHVLPWRFALNWYQQLCWWQFHLLATQILDQAVDAFPPTDPVDLKHGKTGSCLSTLKMFTCHFSPTSLNHINLFSCLIYNLNSTTHTHTHTNYFGWQLKDRHSDVVR